MMDLFWANRKTLFKVNVGGSQLCNVIRITMRVGKTNQKGI